MTSLYLGSTSRAIPSNIEIALAKSAIYSGIENGISSCALIKSYVIFVKDSDLKAFAPPPP